MSIHSGILLQLIHPSNTMLQDRDGHTLFLKLWMLLSMTQGHSTTILSTVRYEYRISKVLMITILCGSLSPQHGASSSCRLQMENMASRYEG